MSNLRRWDASATAGEVLSLLTRDGRHQELLDAALERGGYLGTEEVRERASNLLVKFARKEWPRIIAAVDVIASVDGIADNLADRLARALVQELREVLSQPDHPVRQDYRAGCRTISDGCARSGAGGAGRGAQARAIDHRRCRSTCADYGTTSTRRCGDLSTPDSALAASGKRLAGDGPQARGGCGAARGAESPCAGRGAPAHRQAARRRHRHIARTVKNWDERHLVDELELSVGRDLQYPLQRHAGGRADRVSLHALVLLAGG